MQKRRDRSPAFSINRYQTTNYLIKTIFMVWLNWSACMVQK